MTSKEKATDVFTKMLNEVKYNCQPSLNEKLAKACSIILAEEILMLTTYNSVEAPMDFKTLMFWTEVKTHLKKL
jgi:hypothetical protein